MMHKYQHLETPSIKESSFQHNYWNISLQPLKAKYGTKEFTLKHQRCLNKCSNPIRLQERVSNFSLVEQNKLQDPSEDEFAHDMVKTYFDKD